jgi:hypothetical protein
MNRMRAALPCLLALACAAACVSASAADGGDSSGGSAAFKLTLGRYASSDGNTGLDTNLRGGLGPHTAWVGLYSDQSGYRQARAGYEFRVDGETVRTVFSMQSASGGVAVASVTSEIGGANYAVLGFGRTNVRNYVNLNYDPNDAITLGVGTRAIAQTELTLFNVHDDRLHTRQNVTHFVWRRRFESEQRVTVDFFVKRGLTGEGEFVRNERSISLGYDRGPLFLRFAYDPHAGFTAPTQRRLQFGARF